MHDERADRGGSAASDAPPHPTTSIPPSSGGMGYPVRRSLEAIQLFTFADLLQRLAETGEHTARTPDLADFYRRLSPLEHERCERLWTTIRLIEIDRPNEAQREAEVLCRWLPDEDDGDGATLTRTFAEALLGRIRRLETNGGNLYLGARPPGAQLRAFELLRVRTPLIPFAYAAANRALFDGIEEPLDVTLVDVGIGRGGQVRALLKNPSARRLLRSLHVIGVEPDASADLGGALELAERNIAEAAAEARIPVTFAPIPKLAEALTVEDLHAAAPRGRVLANATLALHHVGLPEHGAGRGRDEVLATLRRAGCNRLVLVEPDTDHYRDDLALRFLYAYRHYGTLARSLYATLSPADAFLVWSEFFAAEVRNVISHDGRLRVERHEEAETWAARLAAQGWAIDTPHELLASAPAPPGFDVVSTRGACTLRYDGVSVLAVMRARRA